MTSFTCFWPSALTRFALSPAMESPLALKATTDGIVGRPRGAPGLAWRAAHDSWAKCRHRNESKPMKIPWKSHESPWKSMENPWKIHGNPWKSKIPCYHVNIQWTKLMMLGFSSAQFWGCCVSTWPGGGIATNRPSARRTATAEFVVPTSKPTDGAS